MDVRIEIPRSIPNGYLLIWIHFTNKFLKFILNLFPNWISTGQRYVGGEV